jgi:hypothetical protein
MSSELPERDRDTELRGMLVATASAAPVHPRRRWSIAAPLAAFALAGALTGAVSAVALTAAPDPSPVTVDNLVAQLVNDDTQLYGEPVVVGGHGNTVVPLRAAPEDAVELAVVFRCADPGSYELLVDGQTGMTVTCDDPSTTSSGGGSFFTVTDAVTHTVTVAADDGKRFLLWASWAARAAPVPPSPDQSRAMSDGEVSETEYNAQFDRYATCLAAAGYPLGGINRSGTVITYVNSSDAITSGAEDYCYSREFAEVDLTWQGGHQ